MLVITVVLFAPQENKTKLKYWCFLVVTVTITSNAGTITSSLFSTKTCIQEFFFQNHPPSPSKVMVGPWIQATACMRDVCAQPLKRWIAVFFNFSRVYLVSLNLYNVGKLKWILKVSFYSEFFSVGNRSFIGLNSPLETKSWACSQGSLWHAVARRLKGTSTSAKR